MGLPGNIFGKKSNLSRANTSSGYDWNNVYDMDLKRGICYEYY